MRGTIMDWRTEHTIDGIFWLPTAPERRIAGRISWKGGLLPVLDTFDRVLFDSERAICIYGASRSGVLSLLNCRLFSSDAPLLRKDFISQAIVCDYVILGRQTDAA